MASGKVKLWQRSQTDGADVVEFFFHLFFGPGSRDGNLRMRLILDCVPDIDQQGIETLCGKEIDGFPPDFLVRVERIKVRFVDEVGTRVSPHIGAQVNKIDPFFLLHSISPFLPDPKNLHDP